MDVPLFEKSAAALLPYFEDAARMGMELCGIKPLRERGKSAEEEMFAATGGVNTHKGLIYSMGLLLAGMGRSLVEGAKRVKLFGETVKVAARITQLPGISGHADVNGLLEWAKAISGVQRFFINHGEASSSESFAQRLRDELGKDVYVPYSGAEFDIAENVITIDAEPIPIPKKKNSANFSIAYSDLIAASDRLAALIKDSEGRTNADMRQLTEAIHKLCDSWKL
jgi:metallo-beta-lactamase family protein